MASLKNYDLLMSPFHNLYKTEVALQSLLLYSKEKLKWGKIIGHLNVFRRSLESGILFRQELELGLYLSRSSVETSLTNMVYGRIRNSTRSTIEQKLWHVLQ